MGVGSGGGCVIAVIAAVARGPGGTGGAAAGGGPAGGGPGGGCGAGAVGGGEDGAGAAPREKGDGSSGISVVTPLSKTAGSPQCGQKLLPALTSRPHLVHCTG